MFMYMYLWMNIYVYTYIDVFIYMNIFLHNCSHVMLLSQLKMVCLYLYVFHWYVNNCIHISEYLLATIVMISFLSMIKTHVCPPPMNWNALRCWFDGIVGIYLYVCNWYANICIYIHIYIYIYIYICIYTYIYLFLHKNIWINI
jgi:hypothetical protein